MTRSRIARLLFISALIAPVDQTVARAAEERLGEVSFPISCSAAAQTQFNRAVAMQHSFFFPETVKAFSAIAEKEPSCAMAYWGIADQPTAQSARWPVSRRCPQAWLGSNREGARGFAKNRARERMDRGAGRLLPGLRNRPAAHTHRRLRGGDGALVGTLSG